MFNRQLTTDRMLRYIMYKHWVQGRKPNHQQRLQQTPWTLMFDSYFGKLAT